MIFAGMEQLGHVEPIGFHPRRTSVLVIDADRGDLVNFTEYAVDDAIGKLLGGPVEQNLDEARLASPVFHISAQTCPFFITHGDLDLTVPLQQSVEFNDALQKAGIPSTLYVVKGGRHGVRDPVAFQMAIDFFKKYL